jgi:(p)ppGpp synthase/HD superfamily hydrolase
MIADGKAKIRLEVRIRDIHHLEAISRRIAGLKDVLSVERV